MTAPHQSSGHDAYLSMHGLVTMRVAHASPSYHILTTMFAAFVVDEQPDHIDIDVVAEHEMPSVPSYAEHDYVHDDDSVWLAEIDVQIRRQEDRWIVSGTRELLTTVVPLVDEVMTRHGAAMIHATMADCDGRGLLMPAWGGVGKTSTMAKLMDDPRCNFMGDDWGFVNDTGTLLGYAKPMFIKPHHRPIYPHLFEGSRKPLVPKRLSRPLGRLTSKVHPILTKYPRTARALRRWSPEHKMVTPDEAFPSKKVLTQSTLNLSVFVERHAGHECELESRSEDWMTDRLVGNFYSELPVHSHAVLTALTATGLVPMHRRQAEKSALVHSALRGVPCYLLRVPAEWSADRASDEICERLLNLVGFDDSNE